jgi:DNA processing protein
MTPTNELLYQLALTEVPQIGSVQARLLMEHFENAEAVFKAKKSMLEKIEGIGEMRATAIKSFHEFSVFEKEISFIEKYKIKVLFMKDKNYPQKLLNCYDPPTILYYKGEADLNQRKSIAIIGTRNNTEYGKQLTHQLIQDLAPYDPLIISGLAAGIDALAHKQSLYLQLPTVGVLGHGLDTIYPGHHKNLAKEILRQSGGLLTEFKSGTLPDKHNFPTRNRIVAGMADAVVVIETAVKGGSMITARLGFDYNRDVFAFPGKTTDTKSEGCNHLIREQKAQLIFSAKDIIEMMGWGSQPTKSVVQKKLFETLDTNEAVIVQKLENSTGLHVDQLQMSTALSGSMLASVLLQLELKGVIRQLPGKIFMLT